MTADTESERLARSRMRLFPRVVAVVASLALVALLVYGVLARNPDTTIAEGLASGEAVEAPAFALEVLQRGVLGPQLGRELGPALQDGRLALAELRGTPVVLNFWASWCGPCREEAPALERAWRRTARPQGVLVLGLNMQDSRSYADEFLRELDVRYPNVRDVDDDVARGYGVTGLPETVFIDGDGQVVGHVVGVVDDEQLREGIAAARTGRVVGERSGGPQGTTR